MSERFDLRILAEGADAAWEDAPEEFKTILRDCSDAMTEAADEIERLRDELASVRQHEAGLVEAIRLQEAERENERLLAEMKESGT